VKEMKLKNYRRVTERRSGQGEGKTYKSNSWRGGVEAEHRTRQGKGERSPASTGGRSPKSPRSKGITRGQAGGREVLSGGGKLEEVEYTDKVDKKIDKQVKGRWGGSRLGKMRNRKKERKNNITGGEEKVRYRAAKRM